MGEPWGDAVLGFEQDCVSTGFLRECEGDEERHEECLIYRTCTSSVFRAEEVFLLIFVSFSYVGALADIIKAVFIDFDQVLSTLSVDDTRDPPSSNSDTLDMFVASPAQPPTLSYIPT